MQTLNLAPSSELPADFMLNLRNKMFLRLTCTWSNTQYFYLMQAKSVSSKVLSCSVLMEACGSFYWHWNVALTLSLLGDFQLLRDKMGNSAHCVVKAVLGMYIKSWISTQNSSSKLTACCRVLPVCWFMQSTQVLVETPFSLCKGPWSTLSVL